MMRGPQTEEARWRTTGAVTMYWADPERRTRHGALMRQRRVLPSWGNGSEAPRPPCPTSRGRRE
jgi:hypothetical protein